MPNAAPPENLGRRAARSVLKACPGALETYRKGKLWLRTDSLPLSVYRTIFERGRLRLPWANPEQFSAAAGSIELPSEYPLFAGEDAPLNDMLFLLSMAKGRSAKRLLEVGTYRARTTLALHLNCPSAQIVTYDVQVLSSSFRQRLEDRSNVSLRVHSFSDDAETLKNEPKYDFIFIDGSHRIEDVVKDSLLAFDIVADDGMIIWHDYRYTGYSTPELQVPEGIEQVRGNRAIYAVEGTTCAVYEPAPQHSK